MKLDTTFLQVDVEAPAANHDEVVVGGFQQRSYVAGPGPRCVIWVAGCLRRCPGCFQPQLFDFTAGESVSVERLAERVLAIPNIDGVTYSGGEPFEQCQPLAHLSDRLRAAGLSVAAYSGYSREAIECNSTRRRLLESLDILIDGEYRDELVGPFKWRGSANQIVHFLKSNPDSTRVAKLLETDTKDVQISLQEDRLLITGFPDDQMISDLAEALDTRGIELRKEK